MLFIVILDKFCYLSKFHVLHNESLRELFRIYIFYGHVWILIHLLFTFRRNWKRRWFVLKDTLLTYHESDQEGSKILGTLDLRTCRQIIDSSQKDNTLGIVMPERTYHLTAESAHEWKYEKYIQRGVFFIQKVLKFGVTEQIRIKKNYFFPLNLSKYNCFKKLK